MAKVKPKVKELLVEIAKLKGEAKKRKKLLLKSGIEVDDNPKKNRVKRIVVEHGDVDTTITWYPSEGVDAGELMFERINELLEAPTIENVANLLEGNNVFREECGGNISFTKRGDGKTPYMRVRKEMNKQYGVKESM